MSATDMVLMPLTMHDVVLVPDMVTSGGGALSIIAVIWLFPARNFPAKAEPIPRPKAGRRHRIARSKELTPARMYPARDALPHRDERDCAAADTRPDFR